MRDQIKNRKSFIGSDRGNSAFKSYKSIDNFSITEEKKY